MANKRDRQNAILELVRAERVGSQEDLRRLLRQRGWDVTQATLSRDLHELRLVRVPSPEGVRYGVPGAMGSPASDDGQAALDDLLPRLFVSADGVGELLILRTVIGGAQPIAVALDAEAWPEILGTIAGDDTILVICRSSAARERSTRRLRSLAKVTAGA
ncbi:MAG: arginine repressor [Gemmatimonadaceae bacterium]